ncbi:MAG: PPC domain-containing protein [Deltaproteobacteria bacterium]|nr:PPC domain-containing protein [Deltaproteobacteria bacterium]
MLRMCHVVALTAALATTCFGCGPADDPPVLLGLTDQVAQVGVPFSLELRITKGDAEGARFGFRSAIPNLEKRAEIQPVGDRVAQFRWMPVVQDIGFHDLEFFVTEGPQVSRQSVRVEVRSAVSGDGTPVFRQPLGTGTTLDLARRDCLEIPILVEDTDSARITIAEEEPRIEGGVLSARPGDPAATWRFCPTPEQVAAQDHYELILSASDEEAHKTTKSFLIVLRKAPKPGCPGDRPAVQHAPRDMSTLLGLSIEAEVRDSEGLKSAPLLYYSDRAPGDAPDLSQMSQVSMVLSSGDVRQGTWRAELPNPVADAAAGTTKELFYIIVAKDNDDATGDCDHLTQAPSQGAFRMSVTNPGGPGGLPLCAPCTSDTQCGGPSDHCVRPGADGATFCATACSENTDCPGGYACSESAIKSVDGRLARQCVPQAQRCDAGPRACEDDAFEENDTRTAARLNAALEPGAYPSLKMCPKATSASARSDDDWYRIVLDADARVAFEVDGGSSSDLDLFLTDEGGAVLARAEGLEAKEEISTCLGPGTYFVRVLAASGQERENTYALSFARTAASCVRQCIDDSAEPDDSASAARIADLDRGTFKASGNVICSLDDDWFSVALLEGEELHVTLKFFKDTSHGDLDVHLYRGGKDLTPCTEADPSTCSSNGQDTGENENFKWPVATTGTYQVVVRGWDAAENQYDICIGLSDADCPPLP